VCGCGAELLPDDRKVKLRKEGQAPVKRLEHRAERLAASESVADREQAVRDLATIRNERHNQAGTATLITLLTKLGRIEEACREAETALAAGPELLVIGGSPQQTALIELISQCTRESDPRPESWLRQLLDSGKGDVNGRVPLASALVGVLLAEGRNGEALEVYAAADAQLRAAFKKTSKSGLVNTFGSGDAFAVGRYSAATNEMGLHRLRVAEANAVAVVAAARALLADAVVLEQAGDLAGALALLNDGGGRLAPTIAQLTALGEGMSGLDRRKVLGVLDETSTELKREHNRLAKLVKQNTRRRH